MLQSLPLPHGSCCPEAQHSGCQRMAQGLAPHGETWGWHSCHHPWGTGHWAGCSPCTAFWGAVGMGVLRDKVVASHAAVPEDSTWRWALVGRCWGSQCCSRPTGSSDVSRSKTCPGGSQHHFGPAWGCSLAGHLHEPWEGAQQRQQLALTGKPFHSRTPPAVTNAVGSLPPGLNLQSQQPEQSSVLKQLKKCNMTNGTGKAEPLGTAPSRASLVPAASCSKDAAPAPKTPSPLAGPGVRVYMCIYFSLMQP